MAEVMAKLAKLKSAVWMAQNRNLAVWMAYDYPVPILNACDQTVFETCQKVWFVHA